MLIKYHGFLSGSHSWSIVGRAIVKELIRLGYDVCCVDSMLNAKFDEKDPEIQKLEVPIDTKSDITIAYTIPATLPRLRPYCKQLIQIYNYETTIMPTGWADLMNQYADIILPSSRFAYQIFKQNGVHESKMHIVPHGIDLSIFNPQVAPYEFSTKNFKFLAIAIPHMRKGLDLLLRAYAEEFASIEPVSLILKTSLMPSKSVQVINLSALINELRKSYSLPDIKIITEFLPNVAPLYRGSNCFVSATRSECFGLPQLEAAACGIPIITPKFGGVLDFLDDKSARLVETGIVPATPAMQYWHFNPKAMIGDPSIPSLRKQMRAAFKDRQTNQLMAQRALEKAQEFTWNKAVLQMIRIIEEDMKVPLEKAKNLKTITKEPIKPSQRGPAVSIIIPVFNNWNYTKYCLQSIRKNTLNIDYEVVVVDNGSTDETINLQNHFPEVKVVRNTQNLGFAKACNLGIQNSKAKLIVLLNNDITLHDKEWIQRLLQKLAVVDIVGQTGGKLKSDFTFDRYVTNPEEPFDYISGHCLAFKRQTLRVTGPLSEEYGLGYYEDTDFSFTAKAKNLKLALVPIGLTHYGSKTTEQLDKQALYKNALEVFRRKWGEQEIRPIIATPCPIDKGDNSVIYENVKFLTDAPKVSLITLTRNGWHLLKKCINSFIEYNTYPNWEWIIVDNGSTDGTLEELKNYSRLPIKVISRGTNDGTFSSINNEASKHTTGDYVLFLNNDIEFTKDWLGKITGVLYMDPSVGCIGVELRYPNGEIQHSGVVVGSNGPGNLNIPIKNIRNVTAVTAACCLMRKQDFIQVGEFNEAYNYCFEDVDLCLKVRDILKKDCIVVPDLGIIHKESKTPREFKGVTIQDHLKTFHSFWYIQGRLKYSDFVIKDYQPYTYDITYIIPTHKAEMVKTNIESTVDQSVKSKILAVDTKSGIGAAAALNRGIELTSGNIIVCCHHDVQFSPNWGTRLIQKINSGNYLNWGVLGVAGITFKDGLPLGHVKQETGDWAISGGPREGLVETVDEVLFIIRKTSGLRCDEVTFKDFHFYACDICLTSLQRGYKNYAIINPILHLPGKKGETALSTGNYRRELSLFKNKWLRKMGQIRTTTVELKQGRPDQILIEAFLKN